MHAGIFVSIGSVSIEDLRHFLSLPSRVLIKRKGLQQVFLSSHPLPSSSASHCYSILDCMSFFVEDSDLLRCNIQLPDLKLSYTQVKVQMIAIEADDSARTSMWDHIQLRRLTIDLATWDRQDVLHRSSLVTIWIAKERLCDCGRIERT